MTTRDHSDATVRKRYPEMQPLFEWEGWPDSPTFFHRWQIAEVLWALKHGGTVEDRGSAVGVLRRRLEEMGGVVTTVPMTSQVWSNLLGEMAGRAAQHRKYVWDPPLIVRKINGKRTQMIALNPDVELPPDPFALRRAHEEKLADKVAALKERASVQVASSAPPVEPPDPGEGAARVRHLLGLSPVPEPAVPLVVSAAPVEELPAEPTTNGSTNGPAEVMTFSVEPIVPAVSGLVDQLVTLGDRSMLDNVRLMQAVIGDLMVQAHVAEAAVPAEPVTVTVEVPVEDETVKVRLAAALEESARLRKQVERARTQQRMAESLARKTEAALRGERERADALEANLGRVLQGEKVENTKALRSVQRFMAERPKAGAGV